MNFKKLGIILLIFSIILTIGSVSAIEVNESYIVDDILTDGDINVDSRDDFISNDSQVSDVPSFEESNQVIYVGQNITEDGGNGSYGNPYGTLDLACSNANNAEKITINLFDGTYYLDSRLKFNTNELIVQGISGNAIIKNLDDATKKTRSFELNSTTSNFTMNNIIFDASDYTKGYVNSKRTTQFFLPIWGNGNSARYNNCTFLSTTVSGHSAPLLGIDFNSFYNNCIFKNFYVLFYSLNDNTTLFIKNSIFINSPTNPIPSPIDSSKKFILDDVWFGKNSIPDYFLHSRFDSCDFSITRYAIFSASENYLGNNQYEIIGKLVWNDSTTDGIENFNPMSVKLSSSTGNISETATLVNGTFRAIYTSDSTSHAIDVVLDDENISLAFNTTTLGVNAPNINYGEDQNVTVTLPQAVNGTITITVNGKSYVVPISNKDSITYTIPDTLDGNTYEVNAVFADLENHLYASNTTTLTIAKISTDLDNNTLSIDVPKGTTTPEFSINLPADATGNLTVVVGGNSYTRELVNGSSTVVISDLLPGSYNAVVSYSGDGKYSAVVSNVTVSIPKPVLTAKSVSMLYTSGSKYTVRVTVNGNPVSGKTVNFVINGKKTTAVTDKNGYASVKITLNPKTKAYSVSAEYLGVKVNNKVTVKSIVVAKNLKVKKSAKTLKVKVTLKKVNGKYLKGKKLTLKFKGKTYKVKTNKKGVATFKIKKNVLKKLKAGKKYTYKVTYLKDTVSKKITVKK